jgi:plastocyanin
MRRCGTIVWTGLAATLALAASSCGSDPQTQPEGGLTIQKAPSKSGDNQTQVAGELLDSPLRVLVTREDLPEAGATVRWITGDGGSLGSATSTADANGIASANWTLGDEVGDQTAEASIQDAEGSPVTFIAHAITQGGGGGPEVVIVTVSGPPKNQFTPSTVTIQAGQTVTWRWATGAVGHNVTPDAGSIPSGEGGLFDAPHTYSYTFTEPGTYTYHCSNHGPAMSGTVVVEPAS